ncbi:MAG TPA: patatin-like phospholipase family protein [Gemmataceae bacterium]|nr:patatin-like phospholipase family protein [Gemmataceae bacterium]
MSENAETPFAVVLDEELQQIADRRECLMDRSTASATPSVPEASNEDGVQGPQQVQGNEEAELTGEETPSDGEEPLLEKARSNAHGMELVGLAFSGGGIRSATFNLGLLQGLADLELLRYIDYLSTVSGGGYIGSWLAAWIYRGGGLSRVAGQLRSKKKIDNSPSTASSDSVEPPPIRHLRRHSNYLAPRQGFLSADVWVLWATYLRNFLLNQLVLLPATILILLAVRFFMLIYFPWSQDVDHPSDESILRMALFSLVTGFLWFLTLVVLFRSSLPIAFPQEKAHDGDDNLLSPGWLLRLTLILLFGSFFLCTIAPYPLLLKDHGKDSWTLAGIPPAIVFALIALMVVVVAVVGFLLLTVILIVARMKGAGKLVGALVLKCLSGRPSRNDIVSFFAELRLLVRTAVIAALRIKGAHNWRRSLLLSSLSGGLLGCALLGIVWLLSVSSGWRLLSPLTASLEFALPCAALTGLAFLVSALHGWATLEIKVRKLVKPSAVSCFSGLIGGGLLYGVYRLLNALYHWDGMQARGCVHMRATAQVMTLGPPLVLLALVLAIYAAVGLSKGSLKESLREWWSSICARLLALAAVWLAVTLISLYAAPFILWAGPWIGTALGSGWLLTVGGGVLAGKGPATGNRRAINPYLDWIARIAPYIFVAGLLIGVSLLLHVSLDCPPRWRDADDRVWFRKILPQKPPTRIILSRTKQDDDAGFRHERQDISERTTAIDEGSIVQEMYWLGILNTDPDFVPHLKCYQLTEEDTKKLQQQHHYPDALMKQLEPLVARNIDSSRFPTEESFEKELDKHLPSDTPYASRAMIVQHAKKVVWMNDEDNWEWRLLGKLGSWFAVWFVVLIVATWRVDVNVFSLHAVYGNRLIRAYLGASRTLPGEGNVAPRRPDPVTGLDPEDDLPLTELLARPLGEEPDSKGYDGPYPLLNTALNLVHGEELAWQERKAEAFVMSPLYCGSETTGYRRTSEAKVTLGNAVALSGAAASPNMGYHSSPAVTVLLTAFNARLGAWVGNPKNLELWKGQGAWFGFGYLIKELFGRTNDKDGYVYLSDGGHFENLGVYELIRRRCRFIIVSDAGQDADHTFEDLGNLIRKCRIDFGIRIQIDLSSLHLQGDARRCRWHCAIGKIRYDDVDKRATTGTLVYIKPSLTGEEPADVLHYAGSHPTFPHETTGNQFYSESQLESYRALGHHIANAVFEQSVNDLNEERAPDGELPDENRRRFCRALFSSIVRRWFAMPPEFETGFVLSTKQFIDIQEAFRKDARLWRLVFDLYPEYHPGPQILKELESGETPKQKASRLRAELHAVTQMLQVMENAWLSLNLDVNYAHPMSRGWLDLFHRWTSAQTVQQLWPVLRAEFARGFVSFYEKQMRLGIVEGEPIRLNEVELTPEQRQRFCQEFADQWPDVEVKLEDRLGRFEANNNPFTWLVYTKYRSSSQGEVRSSGIPCGMIQISRDGNNVRDGGDPVYDFFVWMRGAYRNAGLGRTAVQTVLNQLRSEVRRPFRLRVRLPADYLTGPGGKLQKGMWLTFFLHLDFILVRQPNSTQPDGEACPEMEIVLERRFA